jgi:hypothetical protein
MKHFHVGMLIFVSACAIESEERKGSMPAVYKGAAGTIAISDLTDRTINFDLSQLRSLEAQCEENGVAERLVGFDPEIDVDESGESYPADEYIYEGKCRLSIRRELDSGHRMIVIYDCKESETCQAHLKLIPR